MTSCFSKCDMVDSDVNGNKANRGTRKDVGEKLFVSFDGMSGSGAQSRTKTTQAFAYGEHGPSYGPHRS